MVCFLAILFLFTKSILAAQGVAPQVQNLKNFALELGHYVKNDWCRSDELSAKSRWADFYNRLMRLSVMSDAMEAYSEFFKQTLFEINANNSPHFSLYLSEFLEGLNDEGREPLLTADYWEPREMIREYARWSILAVAMAPSSSSSNSVVGEKFYSQFLLDFPEPEGYACVEKTTKAIDNIPLLKLGSSTIVMMWSILLSP